MQLYVPECDVGETITGVDIGAFCVEIFNRTDAWQLEAEIVESLEVFLAAVIRAVEALERIRELRHIG